jgi:hypothetical protein
MHLSSNGNSTLEISQFSDAGGPMTWLSFACPIAEVPELPRLVKSPRGWGRERERERKRESERERESTLVSPHA